MNAESADFLSAKSAFSASKLNNLNSRFTEHDTPSGLKKHHQPIYNHFTPVGVIKYVSGVGFVSETLASQSGE